MVSSGTTGVQGSGIDQRANRPERVLYVAICLAADQGLAFVGRIQAQNDSDGRRFTCPVRADKAGHDPRPDGEGHPIQSLGRPESFTQSDDFYGCFAHVDVCLSP